MEMGGWPLVTRAKIKSKNVEGERLMTGVGHNGWVFVANKQTNRGQCERILLVVIKEAGNFCSQTSITETNWSKGRSFQGYIPMLNSITEALKA